MAHIATGDQRSAHDFEAAIGIAQQRALDAEGGALHSGPALDLALYKLAAGDVDSSKADFFRVVATCTSQLIVGSAINNVNIHMAMLRRTGSQAEAAARSQARKIRQIREHLKQRMATLQGETL